MTSFDDRDDSLVNGVQMTPDAIDGSLALFSACTRLPPLRDKSQLESDESSVRATVLCTARDVRAALFLAFALLTPYISAAARLLKK
jgi:hypothetical protein